MQMQVVIDIPERDYKDALNGIFAIDVVREAVKIGTPLPKGHGRLIEQPTDADIAETIGGQNDFADCIREAVATVFDNAKTVVEADGGDAE